MKEDYKEKYIKLLEEKKTKENPEGVTRGMAIVGLLLNMFLFPWLGTLIVKDKNWGLILGLWLLAIPLCFVIIGFFLFFALWIWGLIIGVQAIAKAG